ncbi:F420-nonreducing hydrogenase [Methanococcus maripaludis]|jgi:F420-non-reducing hydrogenase small subunit|uniref:F420-non-reducing hydrogenase small subunit n=2 Tax=Methanococcus maripaludis TaxID=39152 RepID=A0A7J9S1I0_METMI|nr:F420-nonreducing hydrogenase [Methanococcus maripaludis]MBA2850782.1 F420-non-reducing hydrogenase small subunit [Methanococcus maripaludis]MBB6066562.1 F420-non-reducing hydrogenase small subunit [Methanococcus maripaludis]MBG0768398.1 F420-nonreducing hydrogenase [Methanococcus maripaludis]BAP61024.1 coenzyme F420-non-reducing hydrogenase subunit gamma [Methanococcus maripaludis KA1]
MVKIATTWLACCSGCHISLVDLHEDLLKVLEQVELVHCPVLMDVKEIPDDIDVALIEGGIRNEENLHIAQEMRKKAKIVIAFGTCAVYGGIPGMGNLYSNEALLEKAYKTTFSTKNEEGIIPSEDVPELTSRVKPLSDVIDVDYILPGCPPKPELIAGVLTSLLEGKTPELTTKNMCEVCPREKSKEGVSIDSIKRNYEGTPDPKKCLLEQGYLCMGIATRASCGAICPTAGVPCTGCYGPTDKVVDQGAKMVSALASDYKIDDDRTMDPNELPKQILDKVGSFYKFTLPSALIPINNKR